MKHGHVTGTKRETKTTSNWYRQIEEENIRRIEAEDAARALTTKLAQVVGDAVTALPQAAPRIAKAATLVQTQQVWPLTDGTFLVGSQSDSQAAHLVTRQPAWHCDCTHMHYRVSLCAHTLAAMMTVKLGTHYHANYDLPQAA